MQGRVIVNARFLTQPISGVQTYGLTLANALLNSPFNVEFWVPGGAQLTIPFAGEVRRIGHTSGFIWEQITLPRALHKHGNPLLISPGNVGPVYYPQQILVVHDVFALTRPTDYSPTFRRAYRWAWHQLLPRVRQVVTVSHTSQVQIQQQFPNLTGVPYIHWGFDALPIPDRPRTRIVGIWSNNPRKNSQLTRALQAEFSSYEWVLMGQAAPVYAQNGGPKAALTFTALYDHYQQAHCIVLPSYDEGFGISCVEAMAQGCVVICSDILAHREVCGEAALYVSEFTHAAWARALTNLLNNPDQMARLREAGFARAQQFTGAKFRQNWLNLIAQFV